VEWSEEMGKKRLMKKMRVASLQSIYGEGISDNR
jgi:hypothetical protein